MSFFPKQLGDCPMLSARMKKIWLLTGFIALQLSAANVYAIEFVFYGNWCGPGYPSGDSEPHAIDEIDDACRVNDSSYENFPDSAADGVLANTAARILDRGRQRVLRNNLDGTPVVEYGLRLTHRQFEVATQIVL